MTAIRIATEQDKERLERFYSQTWPRTQDLKARLFNHRLHRNSPIADGPAAPAVFLASDAHSVIGHLGCLPVFLSAGSGSREAAWLVDFFVAPGSRRKGIGRALLRAAQQSFGTLMALGTTPPSKALFSSFGFRDLGKIGCYIKPLRAVELLKRLIRRSGAGGGRVVMPLHADVEGLIAVKRFGPDADALWRSAREDLGLSVPRTAAYLNWKFCNWTAPQVQPFLLDDPAGHTGYVVAQIVQRPAGLLEGVIVDWLVHPANRASLCRLFGSTTRVFRQMGCGLVRTYSSNGAAARQLIRCGFVPYRSIYRMMVFSRGNALPVSALNLRSWHLTLADSDLHP